MFNRFRTAAAAAMIAIAVPSVALAADAPTEPVAAADGARAKRGERPKFPMKADSFMAHVEKRIERMRSRVERRLAKSKMNDGAKEARRAKFEAGADKVRAAATEAGADGTVTKDEAKGVRSVAKQLRKRGKKHAHKGKRKGHKKGKRKGHKKNAS
jgi:hypothetical protein